ncbi:RHS repeat domain-containing protein [Ursidibacter sp. B-7004-1]
MPRELTDEDGKLCWYGDYSGWGKIKNEYALVENIHQPFRLQNQYCDTETGLHYNFFRYYEPNIGRFTQLDPIGLVGGENLYGFGADSINWIDPLGLRGVLRPNIYRRGTVQSLDNNRYGSIRKIQMWLFYNQGITVILIRLGLSFLLRYPKMKQMQKL